MGDFTKHLIVHLGADSLPHNFMMVLYVMAAALKDPDVKKSQALSVSGERLRLNKLFSSVHNALRLGCPRCMHAVFSPSVSSTCRGRFDCSQSVSGTF